MWRKFRVKLRFRERLYANLPSDPKQLAHAVRKSRESLGLPVEPKEVEAEVEELEAALPVAPQLAFLRDEKGLYLRDRNIKGLLKEAAALMGKRWQELIRHGVHPDRRIYLRHGGEVVKEADGVHVAGARVMTMAGPRAAVKEMEYVERPELEFEMLVAEYALRRFGGPEGLKRLFEVGQEIGIGGDRSLGEGKYDLISFEVWDEEAREYVEV